MHKNQIVSFLDEVDHNHVQVESEFDPTYAIADQPDTSLARFMERPIRIASYAWTPGVPLFHIFNPWELFFDNPRIQNRIANYNLLRCKLNVKMMVNGNGFYYGRGMVSYLPLHSTDTITNVSSTAIYNIQRSQRPHVYLDPTTSQGGIMTLPFVWSRNALQIPLSEWDQMGKLTLNDLTPLDHATGSTDPLTITVFAWASDFSIEVPTSYTEALTPQMGKKGDEYDGPVSKPASTISKIAGLLTPAPIIGPFARATEMAASTVADIARLFGMSRPQTLATIQPYQPKVFGNLVNTCGYDTCHKLTLDPKQELTIDPRTMGLSDVDEMDVKYIMSRESYLTSFAWDVSTAPETLLYNLQASPMLGQESSGEFVMTPLAFCALPFRYWRGSMRFRFQIVASAFHKGRLKIVYDPQHLISNEYNVAYTQIVDIAETRDFSVDVGWGSNTSYKRVRPLSLGLSRHDIPAFNFTDDLFTNGVLSVFNVTDLSAPDGTAGQSISVNVFVSAGPDFAVVDPESVNISSLTHFQPQMGEKDPSTVKADQDNHPEHMTNDFSMAATSVDDKTLQVYFGDPVTSFRQVLKRYNLSRVWPMRFSNTANLTVSIEHLPNFPTWPGYAGVSGAIDEAIVDITPTPFNYSMMTLLNYVSAAYVTRRGGIRWKFHIVDFENNVSHASVSRSTGVNNVAFLTTTTVLPHGNGTHQQQRNVFETQPSLLDGAVVTDPRVNPVLEAEFPFQSLLRFEHARDSRVTLTEENRKNLHTIHYNSKTVTSSTAGMIPSYVSVGEDFTLGFFLSVPSVWILPVPATAPGGDF